MVAKTQTRGPKATAITDPPAFTIIVFDISHALPIVTERSHFNAWAKLSLALLDSSALQQETL